MYVHEKDSFKIIKNLSFKDSDKLIGEEVLHVYLDNYHKVEHLIYWSFMKFQVITNNYPKFLLFDSHDYLAVYLQIGFLVCSS